MVSRLELELGKNTSFPASRRLTFLDEKAGTRKASQAEDEVVNFRGMHFEDWLALAIEVRSRLLRVFSYANALA